MDAVPAIEIIIEEGRQRRKLEGLNELADSIRWLGLINPVTITRDNVLVAGERRLRAWLLLGDPEPIPVRYMEDLSPLEQKIVELEENVKRESLSWQDETKAVADLHTLLASQSEGWTQENTAEHIGTSEGYVRKRIAVSSALDSNPKLSEAPTLTAAFNQVSRELDRAVNMELNRIMDDPEPTASVEVHDTLAQQDGRTKAEVPTQYQIKRGNCLDWFIDYSGPKFTAIHCDFPYGIDHQKSDQGGSKVRGAYEDQPEIFFKLVTEMFAALPRIMHPQGHIFCWLSMKHWPWLWSLVDHEPELKAWHTPVVWHKSDNKGIVSDVTRYPRNVTEFAMLISVGDAKIISPVSNCISLPTNKAEALHVSEKPLAVLRHFFRMFVDEQAEVLDPTCGSGTAIQAAALMGSRRALGMDIHKKYVDGANSALASVLSAQDLTPDLEEVEI